MFSDDPKEELFYNDVVDRFLITGICLLETFIAFKVIGTDFLESGNVYLIFTGVGVFALVTTVLTIWLMRLIRNRKIWWGLGAICWFVAFYMAITGTLLE